LFWNLHSAVGAFFLLASSLENNKDICLLNVYGPCSERKYFWDRVAMSGLLASKNLILAGDLNFTTGVDEVWGVTAQLDKLADYFKSMLQDYHLVDLIPDDVVPTWRNGRTGGESIAK
jgi:hypothetical protein